MCADKDYKPGKTPEGLIYTELAVTGISLCDGTYNFYIPVCEEKQREIVHHVAQYLSKVEHCIAHNWVFDAMVLSTIGLSISSIKRFDTMVAYHLIDENDQKGLKHLANKLLGYEVTEFDHNLNHYTQEFFEYGLDDTKYTWELYQYLLPKIREEGFDKLFFKTLMPWQNVLLQMKLEGVIVDKKLLAQQAHKLQQFLFDLRIELNDFLGTTYTIQNTLDPNKVPGIVGGFNPNSASQKIAACEQLGIEITEKTPTGAPSVGKDFLYANLDKPFIKLLTRYIKAEKLYSSFISENGQIVTNIESDGKVRTNFKDVGAKTGRLSSSNPNFQQLANPTCLYCLGGDFTDGVCDICDQPYEFNVRNTLKAPDGYVMFSADYSGQETYTMAQLCKDDTLVKMLRMGQDQHLVNANAVFNLGIPDDYLVKGHPKFKEIKSKYKSYRNKGKVFSFGVPYGMTEHKAKKDFQISVDEAKGLIDNLWKSFPKLKTAIHSTHEEAESKGFVRTLVGRRRRWDTDAEVDLTTPWGLGKAQRQSFNFKIQGLCIPETNKVYDRLKGYVPIGELEGKRDLWDGENWSTGEVIKTGNKKVVRIHLQNGQVLECSEDHRILTINTKGKELWKTPKEFSKQQYVKLTDEIPDTKVRRLIPTPSPIAYKLQDWNETSPAHNYKALSFEDIGDDYKMGVVLGRLASDGYYTDKGLCGWLVAEHEEQVLPKLLNILSVFNPKIKDVTKPGHKKMTCIQVHSVSLARQLKYLDIKNKMHRIFTESKQLLQGYLTGFFDGDGGISGEAVVLTFGKRHNNTTLPLDIQEGLQLLGIRSRIGFYDSSVRLRIRSSDIDQFRDKVGFLKSGKQLKIPHSRRTNIKLGRNYKVVRVEFTDEVVSMVDFVNSSTGKFVTEGVVVHNCADMVRMAGVNVMNKTKPEWGLTPILTIHDEIVYIVKEEYVTVATDCVKKCFEYVTRNMVVPIPVSIEIGDSYGTAK